MKRIKVNFPPTYPYKSYYGIVDDGIYTIACETDNAFITLEKVNHGRGVYLKKSWCIILPTINLELPEDLFDL